jgi:Rad3-related DNA helicase
LVTLPYNLLLQKAAREALGIDLKDHIVIIDEAHSMLLFILHAEQVLIFCIRSYTNTSFSINSDTPWSDIEPFTGSCSALCGQVSNSLVCYASIATEEIGGVFGIT